MTRRLLMPALVGSALLAASSGAWAQEADNPPLPKIDWSFTGPFGTFDRASLQRGFQVYNEVCSACHSMNLMSYRDLEGPAALGYSEDEVKAIAATKQVTDGPNDQGEMFQRPGRPADRFVAPFANEKAARAANGGALPPDLSVIIKAREGGPDYVHDILTGFRDAPAGFSMAQGMNYDVYFPGHQIAMPPPLTDNRVTFADGTPATIDQEARDVATFLTWASEPTMEERKRTGAKVIIFLLVMTGVLYGAKRRVWSDLHDKDNHGD
jgi:ubiquinol-cytochrome c reductase cytochrome c1 subunit